MKHASYLRVSTTHQDVDHQRGSIDDYFADQGIEDWDEYVDLAESGSDDSREQFGELVEAVENDEYDEVVMSEISRLSRRTSTAARFLDVAVDTETTITLLDDMIDAIEPDDPMSKTFAQIASAFYEREHEQFVERVQSGVRQAQRQGKWTGTPPTGFTTDDEGYLIVETEEFLAIQDALQRIDDGESKRSVAQDTRFPRSTLTLLYNDDEKRALYLDQDADGERLEQALENAGV